MILTNSNLDFPFFTFLSDLYEDLIYLFYPSSRYLTNSLTPYVFLHLYLEEVLCQVLHLIVDVDGCITTSFLRWRGHTLNILHTRVVTKYLMYLN